jgi:hypothetical protein
LKERLANRVQVTSDGHRPYLTAVDAVFGNVVDYAMLVKLYGADPVAEKRYSPAKCIGAKNPEIAAAFKAGGMHLKSKDMVKEPPPAAPQAKPATSWRKVRTRAVETTET